jgi:transposase InsO family protein
LIVVRAAVASARYRNSTLTKHERLLRLEKATAERKVELTEDQTRLLERFSPEFRERLIEAPHTGNLVAVDTFFVGTLKGVGKIYLQTAIDCHSRYARARLYPNKLPVTAVYLMNNDMLPTFEAHDGKIETVLSDNGREFCGRPDQHPYELFLQLEEIEHRTTRVKRPQSNGIVERLHRTLLDEHFCVEGRRPGSKPSRRCRRSRRLSGRLQSAPAAPRPRHEWPNTGNRLHRGLPNPHLKKKDKRPEKRAAKQAA